MFVIAATGVSVLFIFNGDPLLKDRTVWPAYSAAVAMGYCIESDRGC